ncbi:copper transport protein ATX1-like [Carex rostrata]
MAETVVLKVAMSCQGCAGAVQRALTKMQGVDSFNVDLKEQKVTVIGNIKPDDVFQTVSKTGKKTSFWEAEPETKIEAALAAVTETKTTTTAPPASADTTKTTVAATADPATPAMTTASS